MAHNSHKHTNVGITLNKKSKDNQLLMQREKKCHECSVFKPHHLVFQTSAILMQHKIETCWNLTKCAVKFRLWNLKFDKVKNRIIFFGKLDTKTWQNSDMLKFDKGKLDTKIKAVRVGTLSNLTTSVPEQSKDVSRIQVPDNSSRNYSKWKCKTQMFLLTQCLDKEELKHLLGKTGKVFQDVCSVL